MTKAISYMMESTGGKITYEEICKGAVDRKNMPVLSGNPTLYDLQTLRFLESLVPTSGTPPTGKDEL